MTSQVHDSIQYDGELLELLDFPLTPWLTTLPPTLLTRLAVSSALWRGYNAVWVIKDRALWCAGIWAEFLTSDAPCDDSTTRPAAFEDFFPADLIQAHNLVVAPNPLHGQITPDPNWFGPVTFAQMVRGDWFSGRLVMGLGECFKHTYGTICYERMLFLYVRRGSIFRTRVGDSVSHMRPHMRDLMREHLAGLKPPDAEEECA